ncbi:MAG TPA: aminomethyl-transferring glycine dehydrogenase [Acidimicrobiales bacterium]|jgi:glycine dehydrogenase
MSAPFADRHIGPSPTDLETMLETIGQPSLDALLDAAVPASIRDDLPADLPPAGAEDQVLAELAALASRNAPRRPLIGMGYYGTVTPAVLRRNLLESPAWYTAYTPYQPEISQGRLEALLNFQTMVSDLTGLEVANASLLDEATAAAEAMTLARRITKVDSDAFFVDADCHPQTIDVIAGRADPLGIELIIGDPIGDLDAPKVFGALVQHPGSSGRLIDLAPIADGLHSQGAVLAAATDLLACCLITPPGETGADIAVGSSQRFGVPLMFGGPHAGFMAIGRAHARSLPGRLVGLSVDDAGRPALRLALQTREQHIRREKATSNICTAQVLLAVTASMYAVWHGPDGLRRIAERVHDLTSRLVAGARGAGIEPTHDTYFDTVTFHLPDGGAEDVVGRAAERGIDLRLVDANRVGVSLDETCDEVVVTGVLAALAPGSPSLPGGGTTGIGPTHERTTEYLTHPVFTSHRTETEMMRYLRRLSDRDLALDRAMIPLGSCTMKLNSAVELEPIGWPAFADLHPFAPDDESTGTRQIISDLERWLADLTGYDQVSVQPNAGSQGELAGLLAIAGWHASRGDDRRHVCLIPSSAHGTNAASAVMAGMSVVVVACDEDGNIDVDDLEKQLVEHTGQVAALMVTYPSTHGVYEERIGDICELVHQHGGQVYVDGANLNALVGLARPGAFGGDVSHLNLHKTFCIPHGGGGPGVGPVAVRAHLAPFLPGHPVSAAAGPAGRHAVSAAPYGSPGVLPISWAYLRLMGADGLRRATVAAVAAANYVATRLRPHYPVLYTGRNGLVAHECILDLRPLKASSGVTVDDVAKRLIDYGFHSPTMSFPVAGTLMVEPTESESLSELDRFCDAMIAIRAEIASVEAGDISVGDSPLRHAPHTAADVVTDAWDRPYSPVVAAFPLPSVGADKYWPPVSRIDSAHGDRNLVCACPSPEELAGP